MNEFEVKKIIESHVETIIMEIWKPLETKIMHEINNVTSELSRFDVKLKSIDSRQRKLAARLTKEVDEYREWTERIDKRCAEIFKEPIKIELLQKIDRFYYELKSHVSKAKEEIDAHKESQIEADTSRYVREFELRCVAYMNAVEDKIKRLKNDAIRDL